MTDPSLFDYPSPDDLPAGPELADLLLAMLVRLATVSGPATSNLTSAQWQIVWLIDTIVAHDPALGRRLVEAIAVETADRQAGA